MLMSGLKMNYDKTAVAWIGSQRNSGLKFMQELNFNWNPVTFRVLRVVFSTDVLEIFPINYENKLSEIGKLLKSWSRRSIIPFGKNTIIKTMVISKITHLFMNLLDPDAKFLHDLDMLLYNFLWDGKQEQGKIKRSGVCQDYEAGGLKMLDVKSFFVSSENKLAEMHPM